MKSFNFAEKFLKNKVIPTKLCRLKRPCYLCKLMSSIEYLGKLFDFWIPRVDLFAHRVVEVRILSKLSMSIELAAPQYQYPHPYSSKLPSSMSPINYHC